MIMNQGEHSIEKQVSPLAINPAVMIRWMNSIQGAEADDEMKRSLIASAKETYVLSVHSRSITQMSDAGGKRAGYWKTRIYDGDKRKEVVKKDRESLIDWLYEYYTSKDKRQDTQVYTLQSVFNGMVAYKKDVLNRSPQTINEDVRRFNMLPEDIREQDVRLITDEAIGRWISMQYLAQPRSVEDLRKVFQLLNQCFAYAKRKKYCPDNPMDYLLARDYMNRCTKPTKTNEDKQFSDEELAVIREDFEKKKSNPRAIIGLLSMETGLRAGELVALRKADVKDGFLHVHSQQIRETVDGHFVFRMVDYTKNESKKDGRGRMVPLTDKAKEAISMAAALPGESEFLFHDESGEPITKDSYELFLRRRTRALEVVASNNHSFRISFNARLIRMGLSPADRALILGHAIQTNEAKYSLVDSRRLAAISEQMGIQTG